MSEPTAFDPLAQALKNLPPAPHALSRERLLFEAGRASARSPFDWLWKGCTGVFGASTAVLAAFLAFPQVNERGGPLLANNPPPTQAAVVAPLVVDSPAYFVSTPVAEIDRDSLAVIRRRQDILAGGELPESLGVTGSPVDRRPLYEPGDGYAPTGLFAFPRRN